MNLSYKSLKELLACSRVRRFFLCLVYELAHVDCLVFVGEKIWLLRLLALELPGNYTKGVGVLTWSMMILRCTPERFIIVCIEKLLLMLEIVEFLRLELFVWVWFVVAKVVLVFAEGRLLSVLLCIESLSRTNVILAIPLMKRANFRLESIEKIFGRGVFTIVYTYNSRFDWLIRVI